MHSLICSDLYTVCVYLRASAFLPTLTAEFIHLVASEASEISDNQQKKVISAEHIIEALIRLGFQEYVEDVKAVHMEYREQASVSKLYMHFC